MPIGTVAAGLGALSTAGSIAGGLIGQGGAQAGGQAGANSAMLGATTSQNILNDQRKDNRVAQSPYMAAGRGALSEIGLLMGWGPLSTEGGHDDYRFSPGALADEQQIAQRKRLLDQAGLVSTPDFSNQPTFDRLNVPTTFAADPGYQFRQQEGRKALERSALSRGKALSGEQGKALTDFNSGLASQEYGNWWNRYTGGTQFNNAASQQEYANRFQGQQQDYTNRYGAAQNVLNQWMQLAGLGQGATSNLSGTNSSLAGNIGNAFTSAGLAGGQMQQQGITQGANALASGVGAGINNAMTAGYLGGAFGSGSSYGTPNPNLGSVGGMPMSYYRR